MNVDSHQALFYDDLKKQNRDAQRDFNRDNIQRSDQATMRQY